MNAMLKIDKNTELWVEINGIKGVFYVKNGNRISYKKIPFSIIGCKLCKTLYGFNGVSYKLRITTALVEICLRGATAIGKMHSNKQKLLASIKAFLKHYKDVVSYVEFNGLNNFEDIKRFAKHYKIENSENMLLKIENIKKTYERLNGFSFGRAKKLEKFIRKYKEIEEKDIVLSFKKELKFEKVA